MQKLEKKQNANAVGATSSRPCFEGMTRGKKGITLIALIITIIVMLILVGVTVNIAIGDGGLIQTTREAKTEYQIETEKEKAIGLVVDYYNAYGKELSEETLEELAELVIETGIDSSKLTVFYNRGNTTAQNEIEKEIILYRIDKTTDDEIIILEGKGLKPLRGDASLDGFLTKEDTQTILDYDAGFIEELTQIQIDVGDIDNMGGIMIEDCNWIEAIIEGRKSYEGGYVQ